MAKNKSKQQKNVLISFISIVFIIALWWVVAETIFKNTGIIPSPIKTANIIWQEILKDTFFLAIINTLFKAFVSFAVSFILAFFLALWASHSNIVKQLIRPFVTITRSIPTIALVLILLLIVGSNMLLIVVAFIVIFPLCYENMLTAFNSVDTRLITMCKTFNISKTRQITNVYLPSMMPYIFSTFIAGFGLNIKVIISAEVLGLPSMSIGYLIMAAKSGYDFGICFAWLVIAVILSFICELLIRWLGRLCMAYKYVV